MLGRGIAGEDGKPGATRVSVMAGCAGRRVRLFHSRTCLTHSPFATISRLE